MKKCLSKCLSFLFYSLCISFIMLIGNLNAQSSGVGNDNLAVAKVDKAAPNFTADAFHDGEFKRVSLSDYKGKWVILCFYPGDFTFVWPTEVTAVAAKYNILKSLNVEVLSISVNSVQSHKDWQEQELKKMLQGGVKFPMLSDPDGTIGRMYNVYDEEDKVNIRGRFIIDPDGIIRAMEVLTPPVGRNIDETIRQIKALQHNRKTGEVLPAGWLPGKVTLKPSEELKGNVWKVWNPSYSTLY